MKDSLEKRRIGESEKDIAPKVFGFMALGVMAAILAVLNFPMTVIIFLVLVGYFVWKAVGKSEQNEIRGIFEFYLAANDILRDDERRWFGYEINDVINRGERIMTFMHDPPPLVYFALGALHNHAGNHKAAEDHLAFLLEDAKGNEKNMTAASSELKGYVRILRKLEREPAEAPQTMAAIRALERARRHRALALLDESRKKSKELAAAVEAPKELPQTVRHAPPLEQFKPLLERIAEDSVVGGGKIVQPPLAAFNSPITDVARPPRGEEKAKNGNQPSEGAGAPEQPANAAATPEKAAATAKPKSNGAAKASREQSHKSITEVLRDIYE